MMCIDQHNDLLRNASDEDNDTFSSPLNVIVYSNYCFGPVTKITINDHIYQPRLSWSFFCDKSLFLEFRNTAS